MAKRSTLSRRARIFELRSEASFDVRETAMTARETPQARPRATLLGTYYRYVSLSSPMAALRENIRTT